MEYTYMYILSSMSNRVLMIGWDFPPYTKGGLGVACKGLSDALLSLGEDHIFVLPREQKVDSSARFLFCDVEGAVDTDYICGGSAYAGGVYRSSFSAGARDAIPERYLEGAWSSLVRESYEYAKKIPQVVSGVDFDVIHAHDWISYLAGMAVRRVSGKPLVLHVHALSFDQAGGDTVDPSIYAIEREAFFEADHIIAVSKRTKEMIHQKFGVPREKISAVYNGVSTSLKDIDTTLSLLRTQGYRFVLYHGRITIQKGPDYFIEAMAKVTKVNPYVMGIISGSGDMERQIIEMAAKEGVSEHIIFAGPLWGDERDRLYKTADLLVMPSVSEPFGIVPLEALMHGTPVIVSKQSGVAEILSHALKVDFWDTDKLAEYILFALEYPSFHQTLASEGKKEALLATWERAAKRCRAIYGTLRKVCFPSL